MGSIFSIFKLTFLTEVTAVAGGKNGLIVEDLLAFSHVIQEGVSFKSSKWSSKLNMYITIYIYNRLIPSIYISLRVFVRQLYHELYQETHDTQ